MHLIPLLLLALSLGGVEMIDPPIDFTLSSSQSYYFFCFHHARRRIRQIYDYNEQDQRKEELNIANAFLELKPVADLRLDQMSIDAIKNMKVTLGRNGGGLSGGQRVRLRAIVTYFAEELFAHWARNIAEGYRKDERLTKAISKLNIFHEFAEFPHQEPPRTLEWHAGRVLERENYLTDLSKLIKNVYQVALEEFLLETCGSMRENYSDLLNHGIWVLTEAASNGVYLSRFVLFQDLRNYVLCYVTLDHLQKSKNKLQKTTMELQSKPL